MVRIQWLLLPLAVILGTTLGIRNEESAFPIPFYDDEYTDYDDTIEYVDPDYVIFPPSITSYVPSTQGTLKRIDSGPGRTETDVSK